MRIGSLVFATDQGLGILAKDFVDNGVVTDVLVIRHGRRPEHDEWYPGAKRIGALSQLLEPETIDWINSMDAMLFFETPFEWRLIPKCRELRVKTFLMPMHECMPDPLPYQPDRFICPSLLDLQCYGYHDGRPDGNGWGHSTFIPVPVPTSVASRWRLREKAEVFVHNAGWGGLKGRNGTKEFLEALWLCECTKDPTSNVRFIIRGQELLIGDYQGPRGDMSGRITWQVGKTLPAETLWDEGDVFVFPEKFNGLSLPLQEARASGMLVMATDRFPMNSWLPQEALIKPSGFRRARVSPRCLEFEEAIIDPKAIAEMIDWWYGRDISSYSLQGKAWAEENSWKKLKPRYLEALCS